jgi:hypothetical protein
LKVFKFSYGISFVPFDITPIEFFVQYTNAFAMMAGTPFSVVGGITRSITLFDFAVTYLKDLKTPTVDILDYIEDSTANSILPVWDATYEYAAEDKIDEPYASFDLGDKLFNEVFGVSTVTGSHDYVSFTI